MLEVETTECVRLLIVGNGMAAGRMVDELLAKAGNRFDITVVGDEPQGSYNRILLSSVLAGEVDPLSIIQKNQAWYEQHNITFHAGRRVVHLDGETKIAKLDSEQLIHFDQCIIATGSSPAKIPAKNQNLQNIHAFRTFADVDAIQNQSANTQSAVVVGGGLLGLEAAYGLAQSGIAVTLVHRSPWLLNRQLDKTAADLLKHNMAQRGIQFQLATEVESFVSDDGAKVTGVQLKNGDYLDCELAIIATGISPNAQLAQSAKLASNRAIMVDDHLQTSIPNVYAVGECIEFQGQTFGLVDPIWQQCRTLANTLAGKSTAPYSVQPIATKLKVSGVNLYSAGEHLTQAHHRELVMYEPAGNIYRKLLLDNNRIVGIVLYGDTRDGNFYFDLMLEKTDVSAMLSTLIFGEQYCTPTSTQQIISDNSCEQKAYA